MSFYTSKYHSYLALPLRIYLGAVFIVACYHKIISPHGFAIDIATYQILPLSFVNIMAIILPWLELISGVMLIIGLRTRAAALLISAMMLMFTTAIVVALNKDLNMSCGCFASQGAEADPISPLTVLRDLAWLLVALYVFIFDNYPLGVDKLINRE